jgi:hypothetical protein
MKCGLCQQDVPKLVRSHIIPKSVMMMTRDKGSSDPIVLLPSDRSKRIIRSQSGVYSEIVCPSCEASFQQGDDALLALCRGWPEGPTRSFGGGQFTVRAYPDMAVSILHRGFLATLFRAHLSSHPMFQQVELGPTHGESIRQLLLSDQPTEQSSYSIFVRVVPGLLGEQSFSPLRARLDGLNNYRLYLPNVTAFIKVDKKPLTDAWRAKALLGQRKHVYATVEERLDPLEIQMLKKAMLGRDEEVERFTRREE